MRLLLVNANTHNTPPVIPIALEYLGSFLADAGHPPQLFDMWGKDDPLAALTSLLARERFSVACVSLRNFDTAQHARFHSFVPLLRETVALLREAGLPVVLGGSGFSVLPQALLQESGAEFGVVGPGELALLELLEEIKKGKQAIRPLRDGYAAGIPREYVPRRAHLVEYAPYLQAGGIVGFATQYGCPRACPYCVEAGTPLLQRHSLAVVAELQQLTSCGYHRFHLCDSEFNQHLEHCHSLLDAMVDARLDMDWALYMQPMPASPRLVRGLARSGASLITLSVDSAVADSPRGHYDWQAVADLLCACRREGIKVAVDLTLGLPDEDDDAPHRALDFFRRERATRVNVNSYLRVYGGTALERQLRRRPELARDLLQPLSSGPIVGPVFYNRIPVEYLRELTAADPMFKLEGFDPGTNYEVVGQG